MRPIFLLNINKGIFSCESNSNRKAIMYMSLYFIFHQKLKLLISKWTNEIFPVLLFLILFVTGIIILSNEKCLSQNQSSCPNADFELNNFINWVASTGYCCPINSTVPGIIPGRHTIMSGPGLDPYSLGQIPVVAPGGVYSARLGNDYCGGEAEKLTYAFTVTSQTELFIYKYAVVLEDPGHSPSAQPRFEIRVFDSTGAVVNCGSYNVVSGANIPGFQNIGDIRFKPWTTVGIELSAYLNQTLTIEFSTGDCAYGGHFGYAYVDCYCSPLIISSDICPGTPSVNLSAPIGFASYLWNTGQTTSSVSINNPVLGTQYTVTMTSVTGCTVSLSTVLNPSHLTANFNVVSTCQNNVVFSDSSFIQNGTAVTSWSWDFGDGLTSILQNPVHVYSSPGTYSVTLIAGNAGGCADTITKQVSTLDPPIASFSSTGSSCSQVYSVFSDSSSLSGGSVSLWSWNFGDGTGSTLQNPLHQYQLPGIYNIELIVTGSNGCTDTVNKQITTVAAIVSNFNYSVACNNLPINFYDSSYITNGNLTGWQWNFGDGNFSILQQPSHLFNVPGSYLVTLIAAGDNGCLDTMQKSVTVMPAPVVFFGETPACPGYPVSFVDSSLLPNVTSYNWTWNFGDSTTSVIQNPVHAYAASGNYLVSLVVSGSNGCSDSLSDGAIVFPVPVAGYNLQNNCLNDFAVFNDSSSVSSGSLAFWNWNFGDSLFSNQQNTIHHYQFSGNFSVTLVVTTSNGCSDTISRTITIWPSPVASFTVPVICQGSPVAFNNQSFITSGNIPVCQWDFGDGTKSLLQNPSHVFSDTGYYLVSLLVRESNGCYDSISKMVFVNPKPVAGFITQSECAGTQMQFTDTSLLSIGHVVLWSWNFGDSSYLSHLKNPLHLYPAPPYSYSVGLLVISDKGCSDTVANQVNLFQKPVADFIYDQSCVNIAVTFTDHSVPAAGNIILWNWNFDDGSSSFIQNPVHKFSTDGIFNITLIVTTINGCSDTILKKINVHPVPQVNFNATDACYTDPNQFNDLSVVPSGFIANRTWDFGDSAYASVAVNTLHTYQYSGVYQTRLIVTTSFGCKDSLSRPVKVYQLPLVDFAGGPLSGCTPLQVDLTDSSSSFDGNIINWLWDFGDHQFSNLVNPKHTYMAPGLYTVTLTVTSAFGCTGNKTYHDYAESFPLPVADFFSTPDDPTMLSPLLSFYDRSSGADSWYYHFGDGGVSQLENPTHIYQAPGRFVVRQIVMNSYQCMDSIENVLEIKNDFAFYVPNAFTPNHDGVNDFFSATGLNIKSFFMQVYDRYGKLIFQSSSIDQGWNGETNRGAASQDTYVYRIIYDDVFNSSHELYGQVSLLR